MTGGTKSSIEPVAQESMYPGSLIDSLNVESGEEGGYSRLKGYEKYDATEVAGTGIILGAFVYNNGVVACRGTDVFFGTGTGWGSAINPSTRTGATTYQATKYTWGTTERIVLMDGVNKPMKYDGTTGTDLSNAQAGATCGIDFKNHLFLGVGGTLYFSAPNDDTVYTSGAGGGALVIGDTITALAVWRQSLYVFCSTSIHKITGQNATDFAEDPVTEELGCEHGLTVKEVAGDLFFLSTDGIRTISGTEESGDIALDSISETLKTDAKSLHTTFDSGVISAIVVAAKGQYRLFGYDTTLGTTESLDGINVCLTKDLQGQPQISMFKLKGLYVTSGDSDLVSGVEMVVHGGGTSGYIFRQETGDNFDGGAIEAFVQTPYLVFDDPILRKTIHRLTVHATAESSTRVDLTAQLYLNDNDASIVQPTSVQPASVTLSSTTASTVSIYGFTGGTAGGSLYGTAVYGQGVSPKYRAYPAGSGENISIKLSSNDTLPAWAIKTLIIEYELGDAI